jgi:hypothetical protein
MLYLRRSIVRPELESEGINPGVAEAAADSTVAAGNPRSTTSLIASAMGMRTVPASRSTQP